MRERFVIIPAEKLAAAFAFICGGSETLARGALFRRILFTVDKIYHAVCRGYPMRLERPVRADDHKLRLSAVFVKPAAEHITGARGHIGGKIERRSLFYRDDGVFHLAAAQFESDRALRGFACGKHERQNKRRKNHRQHKSFLFHDSII